MSTALLVAGYVVATPLALAVLRIAWRRAGWLLVVLEVATAAVAVGWWSRGNVVAAVANAGCGLGFLATWVAVGAVRRRRGLDA